MIKVQISIVYFFAAVSKINDYYLSRIVLYGLMAKGPLFEFIANGLIPPVMQFFSFVAIVTELLLAYALWSRYYKFAIALGTMFHATISITASHNGGFYLDFLIFSLIMINCYQIFYVTKVELAQSATTFPLK